MYRKIMGFLEAWKESEHRKPLILQGARQVGKTWIMKEFGRQYYESYVYFLVMLMLLRKKLKIAMVKWNI